MSNNRSGRVGVFVDVANMNWNGGFRMQYDVLREFACRDGAVPVRLNAYVTHDVERFERDVQYRRSTANFHGQLRDFGYKVIQKPVRWFTDDRGGRVGKANADLELAVDALLQSDNLDRVVLCSGDGDFVQVVRTLQNKGCRVEVIAFDNVSSQLATEADVFISGYLIPDLLPTRPGSRPDAIWGELGARVRGLCHQTRPGYGFFRFMAAIAPQIWKTDSRDEESPYAGAFFHASDLPPDVGLDELPSRQLVFEFELREPRSAGESPIAGDIRLVSPPRGAPERAASSRSGRQDDAPTPAGDGRDRDDDRDDDDPAPPASHDELLLERRGRGRGGR